MAVRGEDAAVDDVAGAAIDLQERRAGCDTEQTRDREARAGGGAGQGGDGRLADGEQGAGEIGLAEIGAVEGGIDERGAGEIER